MPVPEYQWLRSKRNAMGWKQKDLVKRLREQGVDCDVATLSEWERCLPDAKMDVPYAELAEVLRVSKAELREDHARDLRTARRDKLFPAIDPTPIEACLKACSGTGLSVRIAARQPRLGYANSQAEVIAECLTKSDLDGFFELVNRPLESAIKSARTTDDLVVLGEFLRRIVRSCAARNHDLSTGLWGEEKAWTYRAMIDRSNDLDGMRIVRPQANNPFELDDSGDSTRSVRTSEVTQRSEEGRVHELVSAFAKCLLPDWPMPPSVSDERAFEAYCGKLNAAIKQFNYKDSYLFGLWDLQHQEPPEVKGRLMKLLPAMWLFDYCNLSESDSVMRVARVHLEAWYTDMLRQIESCLKTIPDDHQAANPSRHTTEDSTMRKEGPKQSITVYGNIGSVGDVAGDAHINQSQQVNQPPATEQQVLDQLDALLAETKAQSANYEELRKAIRDLQGEVEAGRGVPEEKRTLLQRIVSALPEADQVVNSANKLLDLINRLG